MIIHSLPAFKLLEPNNIQAYEWVLPWTVMSNSHEIAKTDPHIMADLDRTSRIHQVGRFGYNSC